MDKNDSFTSRPGLPKKDLQIVINSTVFHHRLIVHKKV